MKTILMAALAMGSVLAAVAPVEARQGCGPGAHRGPGGYCRPQWRRADRARRPGRHFLSRARILGRSPLLGPSLWLAWRLALSLILGREGHRTMSLPYDEQSHGRQVSGGIVYVGHDPIKQNAPGLQETGGVM